MASDAIYMCNNEFKCLDTQCSGCQNKDICSEVTEISIACSSTFKMFSEEAHLKCWCNRENCCMYAGSNNDSEYGHRNSDIMLPNISGQNYKRLEHICNNSECLGAESSTSTMSVTTSDESMTSLDSGIKTVIHESVSSKDAGSLPRDVEDDINKNEYSRTKAACNIT